MESTGEVSNVEQKNLYNGPLYKKILSMFDSSPVVSIWLEMSMNWHIKSQGPKKKLLTLNKGSFTPYALWCVESFFPRLYIYPQNFDPSGVRDTELF